MPIDLSTENRKELQGLLAELVAGTVDKGKKDAQAALDARLADNQANLDARFKDLRDTILAMRPPTDEDRAEKHAGFIANVIKASRGDTKAQESLSEARAKAAMQEGTDSEGGYMVPDDLEPTIVREAYRSSILLSECQSYPMSRQVVKIPAGLTGVAVNWTDEEGAATETEPTLSQVTLTAKRLDGYSKVSNELLADSAINVVNWLVREYGEAIGLEVENQAFNGTGAPLSGLLTAAAGYSTVMATGEINFSSVTGDDLSEMESNIMSLTAAGARFYFHRTVRHFIRTLKDTNGAYIYSQIGGPQNEEIWGYPLRLSDKMPARTATGASTAFGLFGNPKYFIAGRRQGMTMDMSSHVAFVNFQTVFRVGSRWGLAIALAKAWCRLVTGAAA